MDRQATASSGRLHADSRNAQPQSILPDKMQASNVLASILLVNSSSEATVKLARIADSREECLILLVGDWGNADCSCSDLLGVGDTGPAGLHARECDRRDADPGRDCQSGHLLPARAEIIGENLIDYTIFINNLL